MAAISLIAAALTRPQFLVELRLPEFERQDLVVLMDRSVSMRARDVSPSRSARAIAELKHFLRRKPPAIDRVGLVGFAGSPLILSYLTRDVDSLLFYLDWMAEDPSIFYGTDIGAALTTALEVVARDNKSNQKLFLVISDGEDQGSTLDQALAAVERRSIPVHTIGIGSSAETVLPVSGPGEREELLRDESGRLVKTRFNESSLRAVAAATDGQYVRSETGTELLDALRNITRGQQRQIAWRTTREYRDGYVWLLAGALVAITTLVAIL